MNEPGQQLETAVLEQLVSTLQGIVLLLDTDVRIALCNPYFEHLTGYSASEVLGRDWVGTFIPEPERPEIREYFYDVLRDGMNDGHVNPIVLKNGEQRLIQWHSKTMDDAEGRIVGLLCTGYDVTEQTANARAVIEARNQAERANASKSRFLAAASHDLRQPLQSLGFYLSALTRQFDRPQAFDPAQGKDVTRKMRASLDTMGVILDALLDISLLESGSITPKKRNVVLRELLDRVVTNNLPHAEEKSLRLECVADDCVVYTDPGLLERVVDNFVTNAIRYTETGQVRIDCQQADGVARISVSDTGIGLAADEIDRIFEEYYRLDNPVGDRQSGLGLGLAIVKHIGQLLDHPLSVTSTPGQGSTFRVGVTLGTPMEKAEPQVPKPASPRTRSLVVLFVDDDPAILDAMEMLLDTAGMDARTALNGDAALKHLTDGLRPDIIISDYRLPKYNGVELIKRIRRVTADDLPTILLTGDIYATEIESALSNCTVLHKPVDTDQLITLMENLA